MRIAGPDVLKGIQETCAVTHSCEERALLPIPNRAGPKASCAEPGTQSRAIVTDMLGDRRLFLFYQYRKTCNAELSEIAVRVDNRWYLVAGHPMAPDFVVWVDFPTATGLEPSAVLFCNDNDSIDTRAGKCIE